MFSAVVTSMASLCYDDSGPDHRLTYFSVQVSLIAILKKKTWPQPFSLHSENGSHTFLEESCEERDIHAQCWLVVCSGDDEFEAEAIPYVMWQFEFKAAALNSIAHVKSLKHLEGVKGKKLPLSLQLVSKTDYVCVLLSIIKAWLATFNTAKMQKNS